MVDRRTFPLWQALGCRDELPAAALSYVVEALTTPVSRYDIGGNAERWRTGALAETLPALLTRTEPRALRARLIRACSRDQVLQLVSGGILTGDDVPDIVETLPVEAALIAGFAHHEDQVPTAVRLVARLDGRELEALLDSWPMSHYSRRSPSLAPELPAPLFEAVLQRGLRLAVDSLEIPAAAPGEPIYIGPLGWGADLGHLWGVLKHCPDRWPALISDPVHGSAVQHTLLSHADTEALSDDILLGCLPALPYPELADLPRPTETQRQRLELLAHRAQRHPRLHKLASDRLHEAAAECVKRGRLLHANRLNKKPDYELARLASDLARVSGSPEHLAKVCGYLATLPRPSAVHTPAKTSSAWLREGAKTPRSLLGSSGDQRVATLAKLSFSPHTPQQAIRDALPRLHPVEIAWLQQNPDLPDWLHQAVKPYVPRDLSDGIVWILTDDELDTHPDPASVLQSWLDAPRSERYHLFDAVEQAILNSRHATEALLRQLPAQRVLAHEVPATAVSLLISTCGDQPGKWAALQLALTRLDEEATFGQLLDSLTTKSAAANASR